MKVALGTIAREEIEARFGGDIARGMRVALEHYARHLEAGPAPPELPDFCREERGGSVGADVRVSVEPETRRALESEARRVGVSVERLAIHAALVYLADLDRSAEKVPSPVR
jgi:hypothetical protein